MFGDHPAASDRVPARNAARRPGSGPQSPPRSRCSLFAVPHCLTRADEVARELLGDGFSGVVITDRPAVDNCFHLRQLGWAHLRRDFQGLIHGGGDGERTGAQLQGIGKQAFPHWPWARDGTVTRRMMKAHLLDLVGDLRDVFGAGLTAPPARPVKLCGSLLDRYDPIGPCVSHDGVAPTNSAAARSLRHAVIWRRGFSGRRAQAAAASLRRISRRSRHVASRIGPYRSSSPRRSKPDSRTNRAPRSSLARNNTPAAGGV